MHATAYRTHTCGELRAEHAGQTVTLSGWVQNVRDLGKFAFAVLRDRYGSTQITVLESTAPEMYQQLLTFGREYVIRVTGEVKERESKNPDMPTGDIEVFPTAIEVLSEAKLPPFQIQDDTDGNEDLRLKHRYLDLRRPVIAQNLVLRAQIVRAIRQFLDKQDFLEIETPAMIKTTPEGARDFLVPSRMHQGTFYALAQSPQILKQLMMVGGLDRYYQICKCFRDEDFRGDRQPEFTQVDCEMGFVSQDDVLRTFSGMVQHVFERILDVQLGELEQVSYDDCMRDYGSDKPDRRFGCKLVELNAVEAIQNTDFKVFASVLESGKVIGINAKGCAGYSRKQIDKLTDHAKQHGAKGMVWLKVNEDGTTKSSVDKFFDDASRAQIVEAMGAKAGDLILLFADSTEKARNAAGAVRLHLGKAEGWIDDSQWDVFWVIDFPLFHIDEETGQYASAHHPFVMPHPEDMDQLDSDPLAVRTLCYDLVMNGNELCSGSVRIHRRDIQRKIFELLGMDEAEQQHKFGFLLDAYEYGAPPHAGLAFGLDRWVMLFAGANSLRDIIAFPKNSAGRDMMLEAPATVDDAQLKDLGISLSE